MKYLQFKMEGVDDQGIFTGHASVFNVVDLDGDVVEPGAFAETLATGAASAGVLIFGQHEDRKEPLGRTLELREDSIGLYVKGQISDTTAGQDYRQLIRDGVLDQMSIGYIALEYYIDEQQVRHLTKLDLLEISIVNYPANTEARIESYKGGKKPMEPKDTKSKETKEQTTETGLTQEQLQALLEQAAEAGAVKALKAMTPEEDEIKEETPPADETKEDCREDETKAAGEKDVKEVMALSGNATSVVKRIAAAGIGCEVIFYIPIGCELHAGLTLHDTSAEQYGIGDAAESE